MNGNQTAECLNKIMECDLKEPTADSLYCTNGTLLSRDSIICNSTTALNGTNINQTITTLNCLYGKLPDASASFIPTTLPPPEATTEKELSFGAKVHVFLMKLIGKGDVLEKKETTTPFPKVEVPISSLNSSEEKWIPEALTLPPEPLTLPPEPTTTTEDPFDLFYTVNRTLLNGTKVLVTFTIAPNKTLQFVSNEQHELGPAPSSSFKVPRTTTPEPETTTEGSFDFVMPMPRQLENGTFIQDTMPLSQPLVETWKNLNEKYGITLPPYIIKVPKTSITQPQNEKADEEETTTEAILSVE